jgi:hypothetical protein
MKLRTPATKKRRQIHVSGINMFNKCGMQFAFRYIQGLRRRPNAFIVSGTATDKGVTWDLDTRILTGHLATEDELTDLVAQSVDKYPNKEELQLDPEDIESGKNVETVLGEAKDKAVRLIKLHHGSIAPKIVPFRTARQFTVDLDGFLNARAELLDNEADSGDVSSWRQRVMRAQASALREAATEGLDFVGEQDILEKFSFPDPKLPDGPKLERLNIRDTKTSSKRKNQGQVDADDQLTAYATASLVIDKKLPDNLMIDSLVHTKGGKRAPSLSAETFHTRRSELDVDIFLNRVANAVGAIQQGIFVPTQQTNWWCAEKWCAYTEHCPYFRKSSRPQSDILDDGLEDAGKLGKDDSLLPILNKSMAVLAKKDEEEEEF